MLVLQTYPTTVKAELLIAMSEHHYSYVYSNMCPGLRATDLEPKNIVSFSKIFLMLLEILTFVIKFILKSI